ncbi:MAG: ABC transporter ATP-binding protein [Mediterraneibacter gnavus]|jgi:putative ABC transport system ATP-binding protein
MKILEVQHVVKTYGSHQNQVKALSDVSFAAEQGEFIAIVGTSGSGKSTLLNLLGGLDVPTEGKISIRGHDIGSLTRKEQTIFRRRNIGFVFQNYSLMPVLNVYDNVALPVTFDKGSHVDREHIRELLNELGLWEKRKRYPSELSGGQQQRVAIARALANKPALLLADEPTGNLDSKTAVEVIGLLKASSQKYHQTVLMVTHNEALAQTCDRIIRIEDGRLYQREDAFYGEGGEL